MFMRLAFSVAIHVELDILLVDEILSLPIYPELRSDDQQRVIEAVSAFYGAELAANPHAA